MLINVHHSELPNIPPVTQSKIPRERVQKASLDSLRGTLLSMMVGILESRAIPGNKATGESSEAQKIRSQFSF